MPPDGQNWPQLWMTVSDVFHIRGRGTVVTGLLEGNGLLYPGGSLVCDGIAWQVSGIEQFRTVLTAAEPGSQVGVLLSGGPAGAVHRPGSEKEALAPLTAGPAADGSSLAWPASGGYSGLGAGLLSHAVQLMGSRLTPRWKFDRR
jgi:hypothetical protein